MAIAKRVLFMTVVNIAIILTIGVVLQITGLNAYLQELGPGMQGTLIFCFVWGMTGAFISLFISKWMAKRSMGVQIISETDSNPDARALVQKVHQLARKAGLPKMPEVGYYDSPEINAFATGPNKSNSLVAVSSGLLHKMNDREVEGVLAHEVAHIANGDMVTMTLVQGIVNSFVLFFSYIITNLLARGDDDEGGGSSPFMYFLIHNVVYTVLAFLAMPIVSAFSRWREYRADEGGAKLAGKDKMIGALAALQGTEDFVDTSEAAFSNLKISGKKASPISKLFMSHPPLEERIQRLTRMRIA